MRAFCHRKSDNISRLAGDEFVIGLPQSSQDASAKIARELLDNFNTDPELSRFGFSVRASIGIAAVDMELFRRSPNDAYIKVLHEADKAMYVAKESGRDMVVIYDPTQEKGNATSQSEMLLDGTNQPE